MNSIYRRPGYSVTTDKTSLLHPQPPHHYQTRMIHARIFSAGDVQPDPDEPFFTYLTLSPDSSYKTPPRPAEQEMVYYDETPVKLFDVFSSPHDETTMDPDTEDESDPEISFTIHEPSSYLTPQKPRSLPDDLDVKMTELNISDPTDLPPPTTPPPRLSGPHLSSSGSDPTTPNRPPKLSGPHRPKPSSPSDETLTSPTSPSSLPFSSLSLQSPSRPALRRSERIRQRTRGLSAEQEEELNHYFLRSRNCGPGSRRKVAQKVGIKESTVFQWYAAKKKA